MFFEARRNMAFLVYADDNTFYTYSSNVQTVLNNLQEAIEKLFLWFSANHLVANADKFHLLTASKIAIDIHISDAMVSNEKTVKLPGVNIEGRFNFDFHANKLIKKPVRNVML